MDLSPICLGTKLRTDAGFWEPITFFNFKKHYKESDTIIFSLCEVVQPSVEILNLAGTSSSSISILPCSKIAGEVTEIHNLFEKTLAPPKSIGFFPRGLKLQVMVTEYMKHAEPGHSPVSFSRWMQQPREWPHNQSSGAIWICTYRWQTNPQLFHLLRGERGEQKGSSVR